MSFLSNFFGGGLRGVLDGAANIIRKFKLSPAEKTQFRLEMETSDAVKVDKEALG